MKLRKVLLAATFSLSIASVPAQAKAFDFQSILDWFSKTTLTDERSGGGQPDPSNSGKSGGGQPDPQNSSRSGGGQPDPTKGG